MHGQGELMAECRPGPDASGRYNSDHPRWHAAYTLPRHEKSALRYLETQEIECFLPLYRVTRHWEHRHAVSELPLFPGYVFTRITRGNRMNVLRAPGVLYLVSFKGDPVTVEDAEIEALRRSLAARKACPIDYVPLGHRVRFSEGALAGLQGTVMRNKNSVRVVVSVDSIMRSISIEVDRSDIELIREPAHKRCDQLSHRIDNRAISSA